MKAIWNGTVIAESDETVVLEGNHYFPKASVKKEFLQPSDHQSFCPWKGKASYYHIRTADTLNADAVWVYPDAKDAAKHIEGYFAFWKGVKVTE